MVEPRVGEAKLPASGIAFTCGTVFRAGNNHLFDGVDKVIHHFEVAVLHLVTGGHGYQKQPPDPPCAPAPVAHPAPSAYPASTAPPAP